MNKSDEINELATALAKAQGSITNATKSSANPFFKSKYADLAEVINTVKPVFSEHGLSVTQLPAYENGLVSVETVLMHSSGQWLSSTISSPVAKQDAQGVGSTITYCRRYGLAAVAGIAQEDDDGNSSVGKPPAKAVVATEKNLADIREKLAQTDISEVDLCRKVRIEKLEDLELSRVKGCLEFITEAGAKVA